MPVVFGKGEKLPILRTASEHLKYTEVEAIYFIMPRSQEIGRTFTSSHYALTDDVPHGAIPFGILEVKKNRSMILGGTFSWWNVSRFHSELLEEVHKDLQQHFAPAFGSPRIKTVHISAPEALIYWCQMPDGLGSCHIACGVNEVIGARLREPLALFYPVAVCKLCSPVEVFHQDYMIDPSSFQIESDLRRKHLEDFLRVSRIAAARERHLHVQPKKRERSLAIAKPSILADSGNGARRESNGATLTNGASHRKVLARVYDAQH